MGRFSRKVKVKLVDDRTDTVIDIARIPPESLPESFFANPQNERTKLFLGQILHH